MLDFLIRGGTIIDGTSMTKGSLAIAGGQIVARYADGADLPAARRVIDAVGLEVFPGVVDPHVHFYGEGIGAYSRLAARGGVTTFIGMIRGQPNDRIVDVAAATKQLGLSDSIVDFSFHLVLYERAGVLDEIAEAAALGMRSYKLFMAYRRRGMMVSERFLIEALDAIRRNNGIALVHAEDGEVIDYLERHFAAGGPVDAIDYGRTRPAESEAVAIRAVSLAAEATACPLYIVHLSSIAGLTAVEEARRRGVPVWVETCPQYILLDERAMQTHGALAKIAPPLRAPADRRGLGAALAAGAINTVGSDHASHLPDAKAAGGQDILAAPFGMPGSPTLWPAMYTWARRNNVPLTVVARAMAAEPARLFGLSHRKGHLAPGVDADLFLVRPGAKRVVDAARLWPTVAPSPLAGEALEGWPELTLARGRVVFERDDVVEPLGGSEFIPQQEVARCALR